MSSKSTLLVTEPEAFGVDKDCIVAGLSLETFFFFFF